MKQFMAVFLGTESKVKQWNALDEKTRKDREQKGMAAWGAWMSEHSKSVVGTGAPLGKTKLVNEKGVSDTKNDMAAYVVVQAESHESAAKMFLHHPHFAIFPGDRVEVMECLPIPGQD